MPEHSPLKRFLMSFFLYSSCQTKTAEGQASAVAFSSWHDAFPECGVHGHAPVQLP
jgi:hypothetical protein